jgi:3',5'-cyclic AMP phosphodiesterase CpdA
VTFVGAGDIANCNIAGGMGAIATSRLLDHIEGTIFTLGDHAYDRGTAAEFRDCYGPRWGRFKDRTRPAPGNHDYLTDNAKPYFEFFGDAAGPDRRGYYSYDLGGWHIMSLNSSVDASGRSDQMKWLKEDLAAHHTTCMLAYWHIPVFSSGPHGQDLREAAHMLDVWRVLYQYGVDVVLNGHDHDYERFAPQDPEGKPDPQKGIREFVVGTGGGGLYEFKGPRPNSEVRNNRSYGVIKFTLRATDYTWDYVPGAGEQFHDSGTAACVP